MLNTFIRISKNVFTSVKYLNIGGDMNFIEKNLSAILTVVFLFIVLTINEGFYVALFLLIVLILYVMYLYNDDNDKE